MRLKTDQYFLDTIMYRDKIHTRWLMDWYHANHRKLPWRRTGDPYRIWVSEVMLQQTQVNTVIPYYNAFLDLFPDVKALAEADLQDVLKAWEGLGYYSRARNLKRAAESVMEKHDGFVPGAWNVFRELPGVGDYISSAVLSIAFGLPFAAVDGNVKRVLSRFHGLDSPVNENGSHPVFYRAANEMLDRKNPGLHNQAMMELGAMICKPKTPGCSNCPFAPRCAAKRMGTVEFYPKRTPRKKPPEYRAVSGIIRKNGRILVVRRPEDGLLGGLWDFPGDTIQPDSPPGEALIRIAEKNLGIQIRIIEESGTVKHAYTHFRINVTVFRCVHAGGRVRRSGPAAHKWIVPGKIKELPFSTAGRKMFPLI